MSARTAIIDIDNQRYIVTSGPHVASVRHLKTAEETVIERRKYVLSERTYWYLDGKRYKTLKAAVEAWHVSRMAVRS